MEAGSDEEWLLTPGEDIFNLQNADHPGMILVSVPLTENNFLPWSRAVRIALGAKAKLGFIDGTMNPPHRIRRCMLDGRKVDYMVLSWLLNSICKEIAE